MTDNVIYNSTNLPPTPVARQTLEILDHVFKTARFGRRSHLKADQIQTIINKIVALEGGPDASSKDKKKPSTKVTNVESEQLQKAEEVMVEDAPVLQNLSMKEVRSMAKEAGVKMELGESKASIIEKLQAKSE